MGADDVGPDRLPNKTMKLILASLGLALALQATEPPRTVALVLADRTVIVTVTEAEKEFAQLEKLKVRTGDQEKRFAALVWALGTLGHNERLVCVDHQPLCRVLESGGRRLPLQNPNPQR